MPGPSGSHGSDLPTGGSYSGTVVGVRSEGGTPRFEVRLHAFPSDRLFLARVTVPFAGGDRGAWLVPQVDDEVLVVFANQDPDEPIIVGSLWNGGARPPEELGDGGPTTWTLQGRNGTRIAIEETSGDTVRLTTPGGREVAISDGEASIVLTDGTHSVTIDSQGVTIDSAMQVVVKAGTSLQVQAPTVTVDAALAQFSGLITCTTLQATTVISATYTPGAGNIW